MFLLRKLLDNFPRQAFLHAIEAPGFVVPEIVEASVDFLYLLVCHFVHPAFTDRLRL